MARDWVITKRLPHCSIKRRTLIGHWATQERLLENETHDQWMVNFLWNRLGNESKLTNCNAMHWHFPHTDITGRERDDKCNLWQSSNKAANLLPSHLDDGHGIGWRARAHRRRQMAARPIGKSERLPTCVCALVSRLSANSCSLHVQCRM